MNLIGEYIDYEGYFVLLMVIGFDIIVVIFVNVSLGKIVVGNMNEKYTLKIFESSFE